MANKAHHQFSLFGFQKPKLNIPLTADQVKLLKEGREMSRKKNFKDAAIKMREFGESLENLEKRMGRRNG